MRKLSTLNQRGIIAIDILYGEEYPSAESLQEPIAMPPDPTNLLQGTLDLLILKALTLGELHGLGVSRRIEQITKGTFQVKPGSLFPALHRMEQAGWLASVWGQSENRRRAKYYRLTKAGRRQLGTEKEQWERISVGIASALAAS
jgi:PadR family transcriptional regulator PadR